MHERLATVTGIKVCLDYEPTEIQSSPRTWG